MRYALKVYYDGTKFSGSQIQPGLRTVEGEIIKAMEKSGISTSRLEWAGRTDKGVSSLGNVFAVTTDVRPKARAINAFLDEDIRILGIKKVDANFDPRREAIERIYKYFFLDRGYNIEKIKCVAKVLEGRHSFHNFCILNGRNPVRFLRKIEVEKKGDFLIATFVGESFLWQQARRLVTALKMAGKGELTPKEAKELLSANNKKIPPSSPDGLVLWDVVYRFKFEYEEYTMKKFSKELQDALQYHRKKSLILKGILKELS